MWHHIPAGSNHQLTTVRTSLSLYKVYTICYQALLANSFISSTNPLLLLVYKWLTRSSALENLTDWTQFFHLFQYTAAHFWVQFVSLWSSVYQHTHWQLSDRIFLNFILQNFTKQNMHQEFQSPFISYDYSNHFMWTLRTHSPCIAYLIH